MPTIRVSVPLFRLISPPDKSFDNIVRTVFVLFIFCRWLLVIVKRIIVVLLFRVNSTNFDGHVILRYFVILLNSISVTWLLLALTIIDILLCPFSDLGSFMINCWLGEMLSWANNATAELPLRVDRERTGMTLLSLNEWVLHNTIAQLNKALELRRWQTWQFLFALRLVRVQGYQRVVL